MLFRKVIFGLFAFALYTCATPQSAFLSDTELGKRLRAEHAQCAAYQGLAHHEAELRAMEEWKKRHGTNARFHECVTVFKRHGDLIASVQSIKESSGSLNPTQPAPKEDYQIRLRRLEERIELLKAKVLRSKKRFQSLRSLFLLDAEHGRCVAEFSIPEMYFDPVFCRHIREMIMP